MNRFRGWSVLTLAAVMLAVMTPTSAASLVLVEEGEPRSGIVVDEDAPDYTHQAAKMVRDYVRRISGAEIPIRHDPDQVEGVRIWVGEHPEHAALADRLDVDLGMSEVDETLRHAAGRDVVILGRDRQVDGTEVEVGTYLAAQRFIEQQLDVRWLWPGELGTDIPQRDTITLEPFSKRYAPPMQNRRIRANNYYRNWRSLDYEEIEELPDLGEQVNEMDDAVRTWLNRHNVEGRVRDDRPIRGGRDFWGTHYFSSWHERYFEDHPEWFALQPDGTRGTFPSRDRDMKLCISNPEVLEQYLKEATEYFEENPHLSTISISPNDRGWQGYCVCEDCQAWDSPNAPYLDRPLEYADQRIEHRTLSDRYARFWNKAASALRERFPDRDVYVGTWAYHAYRPAPTDTQLEDNIAVGYVGIWRRNRHDNSEQNLEREMGRWRDWADKASFLIWRSNLMNNTHGDPYVLLERYGKTMNFLAENNVRGIDIDSFQNHWSTKGPQYYLAARMIWDPAADADEIMADYYERAFGPAAEPIAAYYHVFEQLYYYLADNFDRFISRRDDIAWLYRELRTPSAAEPGPVEKYLQFDEQHMASGRPVETKAREHLERARELVADADPVYRERVEFVAAGMDFVEAHLDALQTMRRLQDEPSNDQLFKEAREAHERREQVLLENFDNFALNYLSHRNLAEGSDSRYWGPPEKVAGMAPEDGQRLEGWMFRFDPDDEGVEQQWYRDEADASAWDEVDVGRHWQDQEPGLQWRNEHGDDYLGTAWYRTQFEIERPTEELHAVELHFGAVDEQAWIYLNGEKVGQHTVESEGEGIGALWNKPFMIEVDPQMLRDDEPNELVVRVHASRGSGGIWRPVWLRLDD